MKMKYLNYRRYSVEYDECNHEFSFYNENSGEFMKNGSIVINANSKDEIRITEYNKVNFICEKLPDAEKLTVNYMDGPDLLQKFSIEFHIEIDGIKVIALGYEEANADICIDIQGGLQWGDNPEKSTFAVCLNDGTSVLRTAHGPAASKIDYALYDRMTDSILEFEEYIQSESDCKERENIKPGSMAIKQTERSQKTYNKIRLSFDWGNKCYQFKYSSDSLNGIRGFKIKTRDKYYADKYSVPFRPINKNHNFPDPPVGWMTWNAVKFNASSSIVLENAKWMTENLKEYGANCIWVDWEWYHSNILGTESKGIDIFNPNRERYPEGLKHVSDEIKKLGLIPALWIAATNDTNKNKMFEENPEWILTNDPRWVGQWWADPSHPGVLGKFIPAVFRQLLDWGYEAFKFDSLPISLEICDTYHNRFYNKKISSEKALRDIIKTGRDIIGNDKYMMSCSGCTSRSILFAADYFDGARIGEDIFRWPKFVNNCVDKIFKYYMYHNILWYADADNIVIRSEFNNLDQARSRVSFIALLGVPVTFGDHLPALEEEKVAFLKRVIPVVDIHPMNLFEMQRDKPYVIINLNVEKYYDSWNVVDITNLEETEKNITIDLGEDLYLDTNDGGSYIIYDFWDKELLGIFSSGFNLILPSYASKILSIHKLKGHPQVISTSRHITQGVYDLLKLEWNNGKKVLSGTSKVIDKETYVIILYDPEGYTPSKVTFGPEKASAAINVKDRICIVEFKPEKNGVLEWSVEYV